MGEMADWALEQVEHYEDLRLSYRLGQIDQLEAFEHGIIDELGYEIGPGSTTKTCRYCHTSGLIWKQQVDGRWRLATIDGTVHICTAYHDQRTAA